MRWASVVTGGEMASLAMVSHLCSAPLFSPFCWLLPVCVTYVGIVVTPSAIPPPFTHRRPQVWSSVCVYVELCWLFYVYLLIVKLTFNGKLKIDFSILNIFGNTLKHISLQYKLTCLTFCFRILHYIYTSIFFSLGSLWWHCWFIFD